jgi:hypothetical protein
MMAIDDSIVAFYVDRAVRTFGAALEADVEQAVEGRKSKQAKKMAEISRMTTWLGSGAVKLRDPLAR